MEAKAAPKPDFWNWNPDIHGSHWSAEGFRLALAEARACTPRTLERFITTVTDRSRGGQTVVGVIVLCGVAGFSAAINYRGIRPIITAPLIALAALAIYREIMRIPGPFRVVAYEKLLRPGEEKHFEPVVDHESWKWVQAQAAANLHGAPAGPMREWLSRLCLGQVPYGWRAEPPPQRDGLKH